MGRWRLRTCRTEYVVSLLPDGDGLVTEYWGAVTDAPPPPLQTDPFPAFQHRMDSLPLEYASAGQRHSAFSELLVEREDGAGTLWRVDLPAVEHAASGDGDRLDVPFDDESGTLRLTLHIATDPRHDVIRRWVTVSNAGSGTVALPRAFSAGWTVGTGRAARIHYLAGRWGQEMQRRSVALEWGTFAMGSRRGMTGHAFAPVVTVVSVPGEDDSHAVPGQAWGIALEWSGNWRLQVDSDPMGQRGVRVSCGLDEDTTKITLGPGESFRAPDSVGVYAAAGTEGVSAAWHEYQAVALARNLTAEHHPVVYNSWYATSFDVRVEHQLELARRAQRLGVETFVLDDGWFRGRTSAHAGLGDWDPDPAKFPNGLRELADGVHDLGMRFGLWMEPEMVNPDSDLYRAHPDWVYRAEGRPMLTGRNQYVLDLGRPEVEAWVAATLRTVLGSARIGYLKWDMNRTITDGGRPGDPRGRQWSVQHTEAYYRLMALVREEFPHVTVEACAGGGGRIDNRVLGLCDLVWTSDEVGAQDRLRIQHGYLSAYPAWAMLGLVTDVEGLRTPGDVSLGYRFAVAMTGVLGIGGDLLAWPEPVLEEAQRWVQRYRELRPMVLDGELTIHGEPDGARYALEYRSRREDGRVIVFVFAHDRDQAGRLTGIPAVVHPASLVQGTTYRVRGTGELVDAASARAAGVRVPFADAPDVDIIELVPNE